MIASPLLRQALAKFGGFIKCDELSQQNPKLKAKCESSGLALLPRQMLFFSFLSVMREARLGAMRKV